MKKRDRNVILYLFIHQPQDKGGKKMANRFILILSILMICFSGDAFGEEITIGVSYSLTGKYKEMGNMQNKGILLWQKHVNEKGGLLSKKVNINIVDDESLPSKAKSIYQK